MGGPGKAKGGCEPTLFLLVEPRASPQPGPLRERTDEIGQLTTSGGRVWFLQGQGHSAATLLPAP